MGKTVPVVSSTAHLRSRAVLKTRECKISFDFYHICLIICLVENTWSFKAITLNTMKCLKCTMNIFLVRFFGNKRHCGPIVFYDYFPLFVQIVISLNIEGYVYLFSVAWE